MYENRLKCPELQAMAAFCNSDFAIAKMSHCQVGDLGPANNQPVPPKQTYLQALFLF